MHSLSFQIRYFEDPNVKTLSSLESLRLIDGLEKANFFKALPATFSAYPKVSTCFAIGWGFHVGYTLTVRVGGRKRSGIICGGSGAKSLRRDLKFLDIYRVTDPELFTKTLRIIAFALRFLIGFLKDLAPFIASLSPEA